MPVDSCPRATREEDNRVGRATGALATGGSDTRALVAALSLSLVTSAFGLPTIPTAIAVDQALAVYLPNVTKALGGSDGWTTPVTIQNVGPTSTTASIALYRFADGTPAGTFVSPSLGPSQSWTFHPNLQASLPSDSQYSAVITPAGSGQVSAVVRQTSGTTSMAYAGTTAGSANVFLPNITRALGGPSGWQTPFIVQNLDTSVAVVTVSFYRFADGVLAHEIGGLRIEPGRSASVLPWTISALPDGGQFGVVVRGGPGAKLYAVVNQHAGAQAMSYEGIGSGAPILYLPNVVKHLGGVNGWSTPFVVQNLGTLQTTFRMSFYSFAAGTLVRQTDPIEVAPGRSRAVDVRFEPAGLPAGQYSVVVEGAAGASLGAIVNQMNLAGEMAMAYDALSTGTASAYVPLLQNGVGPEAWVSPIVAQNLSNSPARVTVTVFDAGGRPVAQQEYPSVRAGATAVYDPRADPTLSKGTYSASVHSTQPVAAIVNHTGSIGDSAMSFTSSAGAVIEPKRVLALPLGLTFDLGPGTRESDTIDMRPGFARASLYLRSRVGGDRQRPIETRIRSESSRYCCMASGNSGGPGWMYFNVSHEHWNPPRSFPIAIDRQKTAAHEYVHTWQGDLGCFPVPIWFTEGMAEYIAYETLVIDGLLTDAEVLEFHRHIRRAPLQATLQELESSFPSDAYPYSVGYFAVRQLIRARDTLQLRGFCEAVASARSVNRDWRSVFADSFGISVESFYAQFEAFRKTP